MKPKIQFTKECIPFIIEALGFNICPQGHVRNSKNIYELDVDGKPVKAEDIIGIAKGMWITRESQLLYLVMKLDSHTGGQEL